MKLSNLKAVFSAPLWVCMVIALVGCAEPSDKGDKQAAIEKANAFYQAIEGKDFKKAASLFSPTFYKSIKSTPEQWIAHLEELHKEYGDMKRFDMTRVITSSNYGGVVLLLKFKVYYTKHNAFEAITFAPPPNENHLEIMDYTVKLDKFD